MESIIPQNRTFCQQEKQKIDIFRIITEKQKKYESTLLKIIFNTFTTI